MILIGEIFHAYFHGENWLVNMTLVQGEAPAYDS